MSNFKGETSFDTDTCIITLIEKVNYILYNYIAGNFQGTKYSWFS